MTEPNSGTMSVKASSKPDLPFSRWLIFALCLVWSPMVGYLLFHAWKRREPEASSYAHFAMNVSFTVWLAVWLVVVYVL